MRWTDPSAAGVAPPSTRSRLVLPAPLRPTRPTLSRARMVKVAPDTTRRPPTSTPSPLTASTADQAARFPAVSRSFNHLWRGSTGVKRWGRVGVPLPRRDRLVVPGVRDDASHLRDGHRPPDVGAG